MIKPFLVWSVISLQFTLAVIWILWVYYDNSHHHQHWNVWGRSVVWRKLMSALASAWGQIHWLVRYFSIIKVAFVINIAHILCQFTSEQRSTRHDPEFQTRQSYSSHHIFWVKRAVWSNHTNPCSTFMVIGQKGITHQIINDLFSHWGQSGCQYSPSSWRQSTHQFQCQWPSNNICTILIILLIIIPEE